MAVRRDDEWERLLSLMRKVRDEVDKWDEWKKGPEYIAASDAARAARTKAASQHIRTLKAKNASR